MGIYVIKLKLWESFLELFPSGKGVCGAVL
ncbi:hypothetical protein ACVWZX_004378 [Deinococcus sp. UYEF24]